MFSGVSAIFLLEAAELPSKSLSRLGNEAAFLLQMIGTHKMLRFSMFPAKNSLPQDAGQGAFFVMRRILFLSPWVGCAFSEPGL